MAHAARALAALIDLVSSPCKGRAGSDALDSLQQWRSRRSPLRLSLLASRSTHTRPCVLRTGAVLLLRTKYLDTNKCRTRTRITRAGGQRADRSKTDVTSRARAIVARQAVDARGLAG